MEPGRQSAGEPSASGKLGRLRSALEKECDCGGATGEGSAVFYLRSSRFAAACRVGSPGTVADNDLWGHIRFGNDILQARSLPELDPYSFTSDRLSDQPRVACRSYHGAGL